MAIVLPAIRVKATSKGVASTPTANLTRSSGAAIATTPNKAELAAKAVKAKACCSGLRSCGAGGSLDAVVDGPSPRDSEDLQGRKRRHWRFVGLEMRVLVGRWLVQELLWWKGRWSWGLKACCAKGN